MVDEADDVLARIGSFIYNNSPDTKLPFDDLSHFVDGEGRKLTEVYQLHRVGE